MQKSVAQKVIQTVRSNTPLKLRQRIGPIVAYFFYIYRRFIRRAPAPEVLSIQDTIDIVNTKKMSMIRFGDGEITLIDGGNLLFQKWNARLVDELETIMKARYDNLLICIPDMWGDLNNFEQYAKKFIRHHVYRYKHIWDQILSYSYTYGETNVTRNYLCYRDKSNAERIFSSIRLLWENENIILIEGEKSRLGVGNDLFLNVSSLKRVLCPPENAYTVKEKIIEEIEKYDKNHTVLLSLGPTAKVVAYELFLKGYRVLDIGHIDMEYEMFLRKYNQQTAVPYKYFNEINARNPEECRDTEYLAQIIKVVK